MKGKRFAGSLVLVATVTLTQAGTGKLYWSTGLAPDGLGPGVQNPIFRANLDGSNRETVNQAGGGAVALDVGESHLYWVTGIIRRANVTGCLLEDLVEPGAGPGGLALDLVNGKMYWTTGFGGGADGISRANLDGTMPVQVIAGAGESADIVVDPVNDRLYWTSFENSAIRTATLDGEGGTDLIPAIDPYGLAHDPVAGKLYWTEWPGQDSRVRRADVDGSNVETLVVLPLSNDLPRDIELDLANGKMYWATNDEGGGSGEIFRANLDGSEVEPIPDTGGYPLYIALDPLGEAQDAPSDCPPGVPAMSGWGLLAAMVLAMAALAILYRRGSPRGVNQASQGSH